MMNILLLLFSLLSIFIDGSDLTASSIVKTYDATGAIIRHWSGQSEYVKAGRRVRVSGRDLIIYEERPDTPRSGNHSHHQHHHGVIETLRMNLSAPSRPSSVKVTDWVVVSVDERTFGVSMRQHAASFKVLLLPPFATPLCLTATSAAVTPGTVVAVVDAQSSIDFQSDYHLHEFWMGWRTFESYGRLRGEMFVLGDGEMFLVGEHEAQCPLPRLPDAPRLPYECVEGIALFRGPACVPPLTKLALQAAPSVQRMLGKTGTVMLDNLCMSPLFFVDFMGKGLLDLVDLPALKKKRVEMAARLRVIVEANRVLLEEDKMLQELVDMTINGLANPDSLLDAWIVKLKDNNNKPNKVSLGQLIFDQLVIAMYRRDRETCFDAFRRHRFVQYIKQRLPQIHAKYAYLAAAIVFDVMHEHDHAYKDEEGVDFEVQRDDGLAGLEPPPQAVWCILEWFMHSNAATFATLLYRAHLVDPSERIRHDHRPLAERICSQRQFPVLLTVLRELMSKTGARNLNCFQGAVAECHVALLQTMTRLAHHSARNADLLVEVLCDGQVMETADLGLRVALLRWLIVRPGRGHPQTRLFLRSLMRSFSSEQSFDVRMCGELVYIARHYRGDGALDAAVLFLGRFGPLPLRAAMRWVLEDQHPLNPQLKAALRSAPGRSLRHNPPTPNSVSITAHRLHWMIRMHDAHDSKGAAEWTVWSLYIGARHDSRHLLVLDHPVPGDAILHMMTDVEQVLRACPFNHLWVQLQHGGVRIRSGHWRRLSHNDHRAMMVAILLPDRLRIKRVLGLRDLPIQAPHALLLFALAEDKAKLVERIPGVLYAVMQEDREAVALLARSVVDVEDDGVVHFVAAVHYRNRDYSSGSGSGGI